MQHFINMEGAKKNSGNGLRELFKRELGVSRPGIFSRRISASQSLVEKIGYIGKLSGHQGCVNTVKFNSTGELLVSGSDDRQVKMWDWATQKLNLSYPSGHYDNIFQAKIIPFSDNRKIITSSADCQVRLGEILDNGSVETQRLYRHRGHVHEVAIEPGNPYTFYSCGEDGFVHHYDLRSKTATMMLFCSSFAESSRCSNIVSLNSIAIDPRNPNYIAVAGFDVYARVYDIRKYLFNASARAGSPCNTFCASHLVRTDNCRVTGIAYSNKSELLVSYHNDDIYLFLKDMGLGPDPQTSTSGSWLNSRDAQVYKGRSNSLTVKGVNFFGPNDDYILSGSDCGYMFIWKKKGGELVRSVVADGEILNQLEPHPFTPVLATCGMNKNIMLWAPWSRVRRPPRQALEISDDENEDQYGEWFEMFDYYRNHNWDRLISQVRNYARNFSGQVQWSWESRGSSYSDDEGEADDSL